MEKESTNPQSSAQSRALALAGDRQGRGDRVGGKALAEAWRQEQGLAAWDTRHAAQWLGAQCRHGNGGNSMEA